MTEKITLRNMRPGDWLFQLRLSRGIVAVCAERIVGTALLTPYGRDLATCNMIIVDPSVRGRGQV